jgi:hypothetical protein
VQLSLLRKHLAAYSSHGSSPDASFFHLCKTAANHAAYYEKIIDRIYVLWASYDSKQGKYAQTFSKILAAITMPYWQQQIVLLLAMTCI